METIGDRQTGTESKRRLVEQVSACLRSGDYSRALDLLRGAAADLGNDGELLELERRAQDGFRRKGEADRLITQSQELFAQRKTAEALQLLREAYELDKSNSLARAILANALVEHAQSVVETDWLQAETLANQALKLNPAHPTAKTIQNLIVQQKTNSSVEDWVSRARKLQSAGDLFGALAWVAEGLAVHPDDGRLQQIQEAIQRDQSARRRQARRTDLDELRRMQREINGTKDAAAKQALAERIQGVAAKYWTDGEILSIANALLLRLGLVPQGSTASATQNKGAAVIFHVPRANNLEPSSLEKNQAPPSPVLQTPAAPRVLPKSIRRAKDTSEKAASRRAAEAVETLEKVVTTAPEVELVPPARVEITGEPKASHSPTATAALPEPSPAPAKVTYPKSQRKAATKSNSTILLAVTLSSAAAVTVVGAVFFFARIHQTSSVAQPRSVAPAISAPTVSATADLARAVAAPAVAAETTPEPPAPDSNASSSASTGEAAVETVPRTDIQHGGTLVVVAGQDDARVLLNGKVQRRLTQAGELRLPNLEPRDYVVQVLKDGFQDPPAQKVHIGQGGEARVIFNLQPKPLLASLSVQGGAAGTTVLVDQTPVGTVQPDGTLLVSSITPGDHTIELRKERLKPRQLKKHFVAAGTVSLGGADAALEAAPGELKINFSPATANVAIARGDFLKIVGSGVPLNLAPGTYTLTARTAERFTRTATIEVAAGQSKNLDLSLAPNGMSKWDDAGGWKREKDAFVRRGGNLVLYGVVPTSGTFVFSAMPKGRLLEWVLNCTDAENYVLFQMDDKDFYRSVIRNGVKTDEIIVPHKADKKSMRTFQIRVSTSEIVHEIKDGESWTVLDRWTQPGVNLSLGKFGFYLPGNDQVELSGFAHYADLNLR